jgi:hypothetical protein
MEKILCSICSCEIENDNDLDELTLATYEVSANFSHLCLNCFHSASSFEE